VMPGPVEEEASRPAKALMAGFCFMASKEQGKSESWKRKPLEHGNNKR
jgi:hypothetical protein